uniref:uncharacterized protein LOC122583294 n=1 Tax=Erigeron canadensis TaxID=72917 RepID=UPI001CB8FC3D|nr:uncharacterized protein LOC122583294 [Erigeron canadensis]
MMKQMMSNQIETNQRIQNIREDTKELSERLDRINGKVEMNAKNQSINFKDLESRMAAITRPQGALPSNTQQNPKQNQGSNNGQKYTPPPVRQEQAKAITTRIGRSYDPPHNPNVIVSDVQDTGDHDEAEVDEEIEMEDSLNVKTPVTPPKPAVIPEAKPYKPKGMPNYAKFIIELVTDKRKMDEVKAAYLNAEDPRSFLITCSICSLTCKALADLGASINLMPYLVWSKLSSGILRPTRMSIRLADHSFQYPIGIAENMTVQVGHIVFLGDFVILKMEEDTKVPLILGRPFLNTADAIIRVKDNDISLGVGRDRIVFNVERYIKNSYSTDESCFRIDVIDDALE